MRLRQRGEPKDVAHTGGPSPPGEGPTGEGDDGEGDGDGARAGGAGADKASGAPSGVERR
jgi:hypothetical protein